MRVQLLDAVVDGKRLELATYAKALDLPLPQVTYHCTALADAGAVTVAGGAVQITARGKELHQIAQHPERRQRPDRRRGDRRRR